MMAFILSRLMIDGSNSTIIRCEKAMISAAMTPLSSAVFPPRGLAGQSALSMIGQELLLPFGRDEQ